MTPGTRGGCCWGTGTARRSRGLRVVGQLVDHVGVARSPRRPSSVDSTVRRRPTSSSADRVVGRLDRVVTGRRLAGHRAPASAGSSSGEGSRRRPWRLRTVAEAGAGPELALRHRRASMGRPATKESEHGAARGGHRRGHRHRAGDRRPVRGGRRRGGGHRPAARPPGRGGGRARPAVRAVPFDAADAADVEAALGRLPERVDVLVNNAGGNTDFDTDPGEGLAGELAAWRANLDANLLTAVAVTTALAPRLAPGGRGRLDRVDRRGPRGLLGRLRRRQGRPRHLERAAGRRAGAPGVTVNVVAPGFTADTEFFRDRLTDDTRRPGRRVAHGPGGHARRHRRRGRLPGLARRPPHHRPVAARQRGRRHHPLTRGPGASRPRPPRAGCRAMGTGEPPGTGDRCRPTYHYSSGGWMNDVIPYWDGRTLHVYFNHHKEPRWGRFRWGHARTDDLVSWATAPFAIVPTRDGPDQGGVWSGSVVDTPEAPPRSTPASPPTTRSPRCSAWPGRPTAA